jgi:uncharacterized secreted protein with C-terminal beta-propeller domain
MHMTRISDKLHRFRKTIRQIPSWKFFLAFAVILSGTAITGLYVSFQLNSQSQLYRFNSYPALTQFITTHQSPTRYGWGWGGLEINTFADQSNTLQTGTSGYSTTNVQVEGVDEPDCVKTDGNFIYTISNDEIIIIETNPPEDAHIVNRLRPNGKPGTILLFESKLVIISGREYSPESHQWGNHEIFLEIYDISDPLEITLDQWFSFEGRYQGARLIDQFLYFIFQIRATDSNGTTLLPSLTVNGEQWTIPAEAIYYDPEAYDSTFMYTMVLGLDISNPVADPYIETVLTGYNSCTIYASHFNLYLAISHYNFDNPALLWMPGSGMGQTTTVIHRFQIMLGQMLYKGSGEVPGFLINQFALDEFQGYLRVATTSWNSEMEILDSEPQETWVQSSNVFILNPQMQIEGELTGLAPGESIYSVRFMGPTGYLVTFWKVDPLFVIDLSNPAAPLLQGELEIPGYSDYLHPLGDGQLLGIGKDVAQDETWWWYQGVKLSIFNATNPYEPAEQARLVIGARGTDSYALHDHKAVLVDPESHLLVLPILLAEHIDNTTTHDPWDFGTYIWQGAYVFTVDPNTATISVRGQITHLEDPMALQTDRWELEPWFIKRSLYIGNILFTISEKYVAFHDLDTLVQIGELALSPT